jgi:hypothetical protein
MPPPPPPPGPPLPPPPPAGGGSAVGSKQLKLKSKAGSDTLKFDEFIKNKMDEVSVCLHVSKSGASCAPVCLTTACPWHICQASLPLPQPAVWSSMVWPIVAHAATAWPQRQLSDWHCVRSGACPEFSDLVSVLCCQCTVSTRAVSLPAPVHGAQHQARTHRYFCSSCATTTQLQKRFVYVAYSHWWSA